MVKTLPANAGEEGLTPGSGRSPGEGIHGENCLENSVDRGVCWVLVQGVTESKVAEHTGSNVTHPLELGTARVHLPSVMGDKRTRLRSLQKQRKSLVF